MTTGVVVQARMTSRRLPGKMLLPLAGRSLLDRVLDRVLTLGDGVPIVVATSTDVRDTPLVAACDSRDVRVHRGPLHDVARRLHDAAAVAGMTRFARVNGDSPLIHPDLLRQGILLGESQDADLITNVRPRSYPKGQSVEVVRTAAMAEAICVMSSPQEREHVTAHFYGHAPDWRIVSFESSVDHSDLQMSVDTVEDHARMDAFLATRPDAQHLDLSELIAAWQQHEASWAPRG